MVKINASKTKWNLSPLYKSDNDPNIEKDRKKVKEESYKFINKWKNKTDYLENPEILFQALEEYESWILNYGTGNKEGYYLQLRQSIDKENPELKAKANKYLEFSQKIVKDIQFFSHRIAKIPKEKQKKFLSNKKLGKYRNYLEQSFNNSKYLLSEKEENILNLKSSPAYSNWINMVERLLSMEEADIIDENKKQVRIPFSALLKYMQSQNKKVRDTAAKEFNKILEKHSDIAEEEINSILLDKKINDELRGLSRPDLSRHIDDNIETEVVDALIKAVSERFETSKNVYALKARLLGQKKLEYHERNVTYGKIDKKYDYKDSVELVHKTFEKIDKKFADIFKKFVENGQIDVYPRKGKSDGGFCTHQTIKEPTYILLNYCNSINDVKTLSHEAGHGINNELMKEKLTEINFGTSKSTAEVASTFMEDFVLQEIMNKADDELKLALMVQKVNQDISTIYRQVACYKFEQELHKEFREKGYLSKKDIGEIFKKNMSSYMGSSVEQSPGSENWWIYWPHIRTFFYVYSYASGLLISKALQHKFKKDNKFIEKIKDFLAAGTSDSPKNIFMKMGIDITDKEFWLEGLKEIDNLLKETESLAKKLGKI
jgi:oligoendopeptidase F